MVKLFRLNAIVLASVLSLATVACSRLGQSPANPAASKAVPSTPATASPSPAAASTSAPPPSSQAAAKLQVTPQADPYQQGLNRAASAFSIGQSAQSTEDWQLVASQWQEAVDLMKTVPADSPNRPQATAKVSEYQRNLAVAKQHITKSGASSKEPTTATATVPRPAPLAPTFGRGTVTQTAPSGTVFSTPILRRLAGTPTVEVVLNGQYSVEMIVDTGASGSVIPRSVATSLGIKPIGSVKVNTASAKNVRFPVGILQSIQVGGAVSQNVPVAIADSGLSVGLLGHDFFGQYDITIKQTVVEFRVR